MRKTVEVNQRISPITGREALYIAVPQEPIDRTEITIHNWLKILSLQTGIDHSTGLSFAQEAAHVLEAIDKGQIIVTYVANQPLAPPYILPHLDVQIRTAQGKQTVVSIVGNRLKEISTTSKTATVYIALLLRSVNPDLSLIELKKNNYHLEILSQLYYLHRLAPIHSAPQLSPELLSLLESRVSEYSQVTYGGRINQRDFADYLKNRQQD